MADESGDEMYDSVIVGGGLSGLAAAYMLKDENILLLEREQEPGGRIRSRTWEGFTYSLGAAYTGEPEGEMKELFDELGVEAMPVPAPSDSFAHGGQIYHGARFYRLLKEHGACDSFVKAGRALKELSDEGIEEAVYAASEELGELAELDRMTVEEWLDEQGIHPLVQTLINVENRGLFGASNGDISILYDVPEMAWNIYEEDAEEYCDASLADLDAEEEEGESSLWTFEKGMGEVVSAMLERFEAKVRTGATVTRVDVDEEGIVTITYERGGESHEVKSRSAILATPAPVTAAIVNRGLSSEVKRALRQVRYTSYVTMAFFLSERVYRGSWNITCLDTVFSTLNDAIRTQVPLDYGDKGILGVALPPARASEAAALMAKSDAELVELVLPDIERYFPGFRSKVVGSHVNRFEHAFPVFAPGYTRILEALHGSSSARGPLFLAGDYMYYPTLGGAGTSAGHAVELLEAFVE